MSRMWNSKKLAAAMAALNKTKRGGIARSRGVGEASLRIRFRSSRLTQRFRLSRRKLFSARRGKGHQVGELGFRKEPRAQGGNVPRVAFIDRRRRHIDLGGESRTALLAKIGRRYGASKKTRRESAAARQCARPRAEKASKGRHRTVSIATKRRTFATARAVWQTGRRSPSGICRISTLP